MTARYFATLAAAVVLVSIIVMPMPFVARSCVQSGSTVHEDFQIEFTYDADSDHTYRIDSATAERLQNEVQFPVEGAVRVAEVKASVTSQPVTWHEGNEKITSTGGVMAVQLQWAASTDSANGAKGAIYLHFPEDVFSGKPVDFHDGRYQKISDGRYVIRQVSVYSSTFNLYLARFGMAMLAGLPFGILLHTICWIFVLMGERKARLKLLPAQGPGLPQTFYPNPTLPWTSALFVLAFGAFVPCMMVGFSISDDFLSADMDWFVFSFLIVGCIGAVVTAYFVGKRALTVRLERGGMSYTRGQKPTQWTHFAWDEVLTVVEKSKTYRGTTTHWIEIDFKDDRKKLKISKNTEGYATLRGILFANN